MKSVTILVLAVLLPVTSPAQIAASARPFQKLSGCIYKSQRWNDGDSFHVVLPDAKEIIFRLYFVDTPEEERTYAARIAEQATYFRISIDAAIEVAREASDFTKQALAKPFTVETRWRLALGRSTLPRYYAVVTTAEGRDLNELLVNAGLARIYGTRTPLPDGRDSRGYLAHLREVESQAKAARRGAWAKTQGSQSVSFTAQPLGGLLANGNRRFLTTFFADFQLF
jgi:endonuclease YncB( thermonuclease family)